MQPTLGANSYKIQVLQMLKPVDMLARARYCTYMLGRAYDEEGYLKNVWWSDECHVLLSGHVNKQNLRFLGWQKPDEYAQRPLHSEKVTVWCAQSAHGIIGPYFLEDINGRSVTVTSQVYRDQAIDRFLADLRTTPAISQRSGNFYIIGTNSSILMLNDYMCDIFGVSYLVAV